MTAAAQEQIIAKALALPKKVRSRLIGQLQKSLEAPEERLSKKEWNKAWKAEIEKRVDELRTGKVKAIPASQVMAELRAKYG